MESMDPRWAEIQKRTFTRWVNQHLADRKLKVENLATDLDDGLNLINLLEIISNKKIPNYNKKPKLRPQKLENTSFGLNFLKQEGIKLVGIGPEDIVDHQNKLILGLIWTIILRYQIQKGDGNSSAKNELLEWVRRQIPECNVTNFTSSWQDGKAICHLTDSLQRGVLDLKQVDNNPNALQNATLGEDTAEREFGIPKILLPEDMVAPEPDELSVMTYISYYRDYAENEGKRRSQEKISVPEKSIAHGAGLEGGEQFIPAEFTVEARNCFGRVVPTGGDIFDIKINSHKEVVPHDITDHNNGTYTVRYVPQDAGRHNVQINLKGKGISGSPYSVPIEKTTVSSHGPGLEKGEQYLAGNFTIDAKKLLQHNVLPPQSEFVVSIAAPKSPVQAHTVDNNDGTFGVTYTPVDAGRHTITVTLRGRLLANGPFSVPIDKTNCTASGPGLEKAEQYIPAEFTVQALNLFKNGIPTSPSDFDVSITGPKGRVPAQITDNNDGTYKVVYVPDTAGRVTIAVTLKGQPISNGPFNVPVDKTSVTASGPGLEKAEQFLPAPFTVDAKKLHDSNTPVAAEDIEVKVTGPNGALPADVKDNGDGTFGVTYTPPAPGRVTVAVTLKGQPIGNGPFSVPVDKTSATASGPGLERAEQFIPAPFTVNAKKLHDAGVPVTADDIDVKANGPTGPLPVDVKDNGDGTFDVAYTPKDQGRVNVAVALKGTPIGGPFSVPVDKTSATASGPGLEKAEQFIPATFTVQAKKLHDSKVPLKPEDIDAKVTGPNGQIPVDIKDNDDGTFTVTYTPQDPGRVGVAVAVKGQPIAQSSVPVNKSGVTLSGPGLEKAEQYIPTDFGINAKNLADQGLAPSADDFKVDIAGPEGPVPAEIKDNGDGTFTVGYTPQVPGRHAVNVALKGKPIGNLSVPVDRSTCDPSKSTASGPGLEPGNVIDKPTHFTIQARNRIGDPMKTGGDPFVVKIAAPRNTTVQPKITDNKNGTYLVEYEPNLVGPHNVDVSLRGVPIQGNPWTVDVGRDDNSADPNHTIAYGPGLEGGDTADPSTFTIETRNSKNERLNHGGERVAVEVIEPSGGRLPVSLVDNNDGTYSVSYQASNPGNHTVNVIIKSKLPNHFDHIKDSPFTVPIKTGTDASLSLVYGPGLEDAYDTKPAVFHIKARDRFGNEMKRGGDPFKVNVTGPNGEVPVDIKDNGDGTYDVTYHPVDHGKHRIDVGLRGKPVARSPYTVNVKEGAAYDHTFIESYTFTIRTRTKAGQDKKVGGETFSVSINGPSGAVDTVKTRDVGDGTYVVSYSLPAAGEYTVAVELNGHNIKGSPWKQIAV